MPRPRHRRAVVQARTTPFPPRSGPALPLLPLLRRLPPPDDDGVPMGGKPAAPTGILGSFGSSWRTSVATILVPQWAARTRLQFGGLLALAFAVVCLFLPGPADPFPRLKKLGEMEAARRA